MKLSPLVIASHNEGKVKEIRELLAGQRIEVLSARELNLAEPVEDGKTFEDNAKIKSLAIATASKRNALADDSGLCVEALNGEPGVYSARWAGETKDFIYAMQRIHDSLEAKKIDPEGAKASFVCVLSLTFADTKETVQFRGEVRGSLTFPARGLHGFGYDPIFIPAGQTQTFAEMNAQQKYALSHRSRAFEQFVAWVNKKEKAAS